MAPRWGGLRPEPYNPDAQDADGDGIVQEGTAWERPAGTRILMEAGEEIGRGLTADARPAGARIVDRDGNDVDYSPTWLRAGGAARVEVQQSPLADHGARSLREMGVPSLRDIVARSFAPPAAAPVEAAADPREGRIRRIRERIRRRNKEVKDAVAAAGGALFDRSDKSIDKLKKTLQQSPEGRDLLSGGLFQPETLDESYKEVVTSISAELRKVRQGLLDGDESYQDMHPDVKNLVLNSTDDELLKIIEAQAVEFHRGVDKRVRVRVPNDRLASIIKDGRYKSTHEVYSTQSGPDFRGRYEMSLGYPPDVDPSTRPVSGYAVHPDWEQASVEMFEKKYGRKPTEFEQVTQFAGPVGAYGRIEVILRPEVSGRSAYGEGDSLSTELLPARFDSDDPREIMKAQFSQGGRELSKNEGMALGLLKSRVVGNFTDIASPWAGKKDSFTDTEGTDFDFARKGSYHEALVAGGFDLEDIEEVKIPYESLGHSFYFGDPDFFDNGYLVPDDPTSVPTSVFNEEKSQAVADALEGEFFSPAALRLAGLSEEEISEFRKLFEGWKAGKSGVDEWDSYEKPFDPRNIPVQLPEDLMSELWSVLWFRKASKVKGELEAKGVKVTATLDPSGKPTVDNEKLRRYGLGAFELRNDIFDLKAWDDPKGLGSIDEILADKTREAVAARIRDRLAEIKRRDNMSGRSGRG